MLPASPAMSADVLVRRGSGYMHIVAFTYQPEFTVIRDPSFRRLSPPPPGRVGYYGEIAFRQMPN